MSGKVVGRVVACPLVFLFVGSSSKLPAQAFLVSCVKGISSWVGAK